MVMLVAASVCRDCLEARLLEDYYVSNRTVCKDCVKRRVKANRRKSIESVRSYDRQRATLPKRQENVKRVVREWRETNPAGYKAHCKLAYAVRAGIVVKPAECEGCARPGKVEAHHHDYAKPLIVAWLCKPCHAIADKIRRKFEAA